MISAPHPEGIYVFSLDKGKIVILDTDTGVDIKNLSPFEYMKFFVQNCSESEIDRNPKLEGTAELKKIDGKLVIVNDTTKDENGHFKIKYKPGKRYYKSDEDERKYNPYFEG